MKGNTILNITGMDRIREEARETILIQGYKGREYDKEYVGSLTDEEIFTKHQGEIERRKQGLKGYVFPPLIWDRLQAMKRTPKEIRATYGNTLVLSLREGEIKHHFTDALIIGIPKKAHVKAAVWGSWCATTEEAVIKHRAKVLNWCKDNDPVKYHIMEFLSVGGGCAKAPHP